MDGGMTAQVAGESVPLIWTSTYTVQGVALIAKLQAGVTLHVTRVVSGAGYVNPEALPIQSGVTDPRKEFGVGKATARRDGLTRLPVQLINKGITAGYSLWQVGVYAADPDEGEVLYCIMQSSSPDYIPAEMQMPGFMVNFGINLVVGNAPYIQATIDPEGLVTNETLESRLEPLEPYYELIQITHGLGEYPQVLLGQLQHGLGLGALGDNPIGASDVTQLPVRAVYHDSRALTVQTIQSIVQLGTNPELYWKNAREYFLTWPDNQSDSLYIRLI